MTTKKLGVLAFAAALFAGACADPAGPTGGAPQLAGPSAALNPIPGYPFPSSNGQPRPNDGDGWVRLCKVSNTAGTFNFDFAVNGAVDGISDVSITVAAGQEGTRVCRSTPLYNSDAGSTSIDVVNIVELDPGANWSVPTVDIDQYYQVGVTYHANALLDEYNVAPRTAKVFINDDLEKVAIFTNTFTAPPVTGCTYTKGWYGNKNGAPTVVAVDGRSQTEAQTILGSTPGKPNGVTWGSDNLLHNLYQQLLTAILNLNGASGPAAVNTAIADALAGTGGTGLNITTTLTHDEMAALVETLSAFNEGTFAGWPHCPD